MKGVKLFYIINWTRRLTKPFHLNTDLTTSKWVTLQVPFPSTTRGIKHAVGLGKFILSVVVVLVVIYYYYYFFVEHSFLQIRVYFCFSPISREKKKPLFPILPSWPVENANNLILFKCLSSMSCVKRLKGLVCEETLAPCRWRSETRRFAIKRSDEGLSLEINS